MAHPARNASREKPPGELRDGVRVFRVRDPILPALGRATRGEARAQSSRGSELATHRRTAAEKPFVSPPPDEARCPGPRISFAADVRMPPLRPNAMALAPLLSTDDGRCRPRSAADKGTGGFPLLNPDSKKNANHLAMDSVQILREPGPRRPPTATELEHRVHRSRKNTQKSFLFPIPGVSVTGIGKKGLPHRTGGCRYTLTNAPTM